VREQVRITIAATAAIAAVTLLAAPSASAAFPGQNGRIAFTHDPGTPGFGDIFAIDPTGESMAQLTTGTDDDFGPSYSADGERIAFSRQPGGTGSSQIWVMSHDGSGQTQLTGAPNFDFEPAFSPDGARIAFQRFDGTSTQIWIMGSDGSDQTQLTFPGPNDDFAFNASFSPDGQRIAFSRFDGATGFSGIWGMSADGSGQAPLTTGSATAQDFEPDFSPDGQRIVFRRLTPGVQSEIWVMNPDGSGQAPLTDTASDNDFAPVFSPDGTRIAFEREDSGGTFGNIVLADSTGLNQNVSPVTSSSAPVYDYDPSWQPLNPPACELTGQAKQKSVKRVSVTVTCPNENATVVAEGLGKAPKAPKVGLALASKAKKFKIPAVTAQVPEGTPTSVTLKIPKKGKKALKKAAKAGKKGKATIIATLTDDLGQSSQDSFAVKFKAKKKK
jgi:TolB protein